MLSIYVGSDLRRLHLELDKLRSYASGRAITPADVQLLVSDTSEALIWDLTGRHRSTRRTQGHAGLVRAAA